ncbi:hypothetical protein [Sorangium sp. So ce1097]|uniref:hypothetical protein n=1 Tax=Sorangium sp. So ce1097 TaxID=3133330 RepID=UPI003F622DFE
MLSIHGKVLGLAMVMAAIGTGCAVDAADAELDMEGLDEVEAIDEAAAALEEGDEEERGGYQAPGKDLLGPGKGGLDKGMLGPQAPVGQLGPAQVGQVGQAPVGQLGPAQVGQVGQAPIGQAPIGQAPIGQVPIGQGPVGAPVGVPPVGVPGGVGAPGLGGFGAPGLGGFGFPGAFGVSRFIGGCPGFFGGSPVTINNNTNNIDINLIALLEDQFRNSHRVCPPVHAGPLVRHCPCSRPRPPMGSTFGPPGFGPPGFGPPGFGPPGFGPAGFGPPGFGPAAAFGPPPFGAFAPAAAPCARVPGSGPFGWGSC